MSCQVIDWESLREISGGNEAIEAELFAMFGETFDACMARLKAGEWHDAAHALKGAAGNIRADQLAELCRQAERMTGDEGKPQMCRRLEEAYLAFSEYRKSAKP